MPEKDERMSRLLEYLIFPGTIWYVMLFAAFKAVGALTLSWGWIALPFAFIPLLIVTGLMLGFFIGGREAYKEKLRRVEAERALNNAIFQKVEEAKREIEAHPEVN